MKKLLIVLLAALLVVSMVSCSKQAADTDKVSSEQTETPVAETEKIASEKSTEPASSEVPPVAKTPSKQDVSKDAPKASAEPEPEIEAVVTHAPSTNKTVVTSENAPTVFWAMDTLYHLEGCKSLEGKDSNQISWSVVEQVMLRQCPVCNPPQYAGYVEN